MSVFRMTRSSDIEVDIIEELVGGLLELVVAQIGACLDFCADAVDQIGTLLRLGLELAEILCNAGEFDAIRTPSPTTAPDFLCAGLTRVRRIDTDPSHTETRSVVDG